MKQRVRKAIIPAAGLSVLFITNIFEKNIYEINSLFLGFII